MSADLSNLEVRINALIAEHRRVCEENTGLQQNMDELLAQNRALKVRLKRILDRIRALELETA